MVNNFVALKAAAKMLRHHKTMFKHITILACHRLKLWRTTNHYIALLRFNVATAGRSIDQEQFNRLLDIYYEKRGWDENGLPYNELEAAFSAPC